MGVLGHAVARSTASEFGVLASCDPSHVRAVKAEIGCVVEALQSGWILRFVVRALAVWIESVPDLIDKFSAAKVRLAEFTAPDAKLMLVVSAKKVQRITESNPAIYHEGARSVLVFSSKLRLAVRETSEEVRQKIKSAKDSVIVADVTVRRTRGHSAARRARSA
jgi:hypothetical protein